MSQPTHTPARETGDISLDQMIEWHTVPAITRLHARLNGLSRDQKRRLIIAWMGAR